MATEQEKELVRERTNIVDLVSSYTRLKKAGSFKHKGICPFHQEKDASFTVDEERKLWHCFGCQKGGDVFSFVMEVENLDFGEAVEFLAKRAGVALTDARSPDSPRKKIKDRLLKVNELAARYFAKVLRASRSGEKFMEYLGNRGVTEEQIKSFKLGASLDSWDGIIRTLGKKDVTPGELAQAGLVIVNESGRHYDRFRDRLMFPLTNAVGDVVGFAGRAWGDAMPKYLNTPETPLFDKGKMVYALDKAKKKVGPHGIILTEGYMDVIALHRAGFESAVASMGTALTPAQVDLVRRYSMKVVLSYDSDIAGDSASMRGIEMLIDRGMDIRVVTLPDGEDPDSIVTKGGPEAFAARLDAAEDYFDFFLSKSIQRIGAETPAQKREALLQMAPLVEKTPNDILRDEQKKKLGERLGVSEQNVHTALLQMRESRRGGRPTDEMDGEVERMMAPGVKVEKRLLEIMLSSEGAAKMVLDRLEPVDFSDRNLGAFFMYCRKYREKTGGFSPNDFLNSVHPQEAVRIISGIRLAGGASAEEAEKEATSVLDNFVKAAQKRRLGDLRRQIQKAQKDGDEALATQLASKLLELKRNE